MLEQKDTLTSEKSSINLELYFQMLNELKRGIHLTGEELTLKELADLESSVKEVARTLQLTKSRKWQNLLASHSWLQKGTGKDL